MVMTAGTEQFADFSGANGGLTPPQKNFWYTNYGTQAGVHDVEDEAVAILLLIAAAGELNRSTWRQFGPWFLQRFGIPSGDELLRMLKSSLLFGPEVATRYVSKRERSRATNPFFIALFAEQILPRLGVRTGVSKIMECEEARKLSSTHIVKFGSPGARLKWHSRPEGEYALVSPILHDVASIDFVRRVILSMNERFDIRNVFSIEPESGDSPFIRFEESQVQHLVGCASKSCGLADKHFGDFKPTENEVSAIRRAIWWSSAGYSRIHAARIFLGLTCGHFSNVLVTRGGELISIDHDLAHFEDGTDVEMLFRFTRRESEVGKLLNEIARLTEADIRSAIAAIPQHPACGPVGELEQHFIERLKLWKRLAGCEEKTGRAQVCTAAV